MSLQPVPQEPTGGVLIPIITSDDPDFNHKAAHKAAQMVMKCASDEEAEMLTYFTMADIVETDIEKNQRTLQRHLNNVVLKRLERTKHALMATVSKSNDPQALAYAEALTKIEKRITDPEGYFWETVSKATAGWKNPYMTGAYQFEESDFRRDPRSGRFQAKVSVNPNMRPMNNKQAKNLGVPTKSPEYNQLSPKAKAQYQQEYMQIANFLNLATEMGDNESWVQVSNKSNRQRHWRQINGTPKPGRDWDPEVERVIGVEARPTGGLSLGGASFGLVNSLGGDARTAGVINRADAKFNQFSDDWSRPKSDSYNSNQRLYSRVGVGSQFLADVAPYDSRLQIAARFGRAVGSHGPQAEKVLGPSIRRTAYRYRGVEKTPDKDAMKAFQASVADATAIELDDAQRKTMRARQTRAITALRNRKATETNTPVEAVKLTQAEVARERANVERAFMESAQTKARGTASDAGAAALVAWLTERDEDSPKLKRGPDKDLYALQLEAGSTPPSEGFIIDRNGKVVTQAVGYGDDHYLPFNLKNLKKLDGGQYVRTRSVGGPTSEDIYTGLLAGAKRITVVSRSGTFTIDFADDFTGKRRYNDKAKRMVGRYERLLDAVQSEVVPRNQQVAPAVRARITQEVNEELGALTPRERREAITQRLNEYKDELSSTEKEEFRTLIEANSESLDERDRRAYVAQAMNDWDRHSEFKFRLNGLGYKDALKALEEQFPYYIKTNYVPTKELERFESEKDKGYVEPGRLRPTEANAGWRGTSANPGSGFISASHVNYQRGKYGVEGDEPRTKFSGGAQQGVQQDTTAKESAEKTTEETPQPKSVRTQLAERENQLKYETAATELVKAMREHTTLLQKPGAVDQFPVLAMEDEDARKFFKSKENVRTADEFIEAISGSLTGPAAPAPLREAYSNYAKATSRIGRAEYDPKLQLTRSGSPFLFPNEAPYEPGADPTLAEREAKRLDKFQPVSSSGLKLSNMDAAELDNELDVLTRLKSGLDFVKEMKGKEKVDTLKSLGIDTDIPGVSKILEGEKFSAHAEAVQRMRALNLNRGQRTPTQTQVQTKYLEPPTEAEVQDRKKNLSYYVTALTNAGAKIHEGDDDGSLTDLSDQMYLKAAALKERLKQDEISAGDYKTAIDEITALGLLAEDVNRGLATKQQLEEFRDRLDS